MIGGPQLGQRGRREKVLKNNSESVVESSRRFRRILVLARCRAPPPGWSDAFSHAVATPTISDLLSSLRSDLPWLIMRLMIKMTMGPPKGELFQVWMGSWGRLSSGLTRSSSHGPAGVGNGPSYLAAALLLPTPAVGQLCRRHLKLALITGFFLSGFLCGPICLGFLSDGALRDLAFVGRSASGLSESLRVPSSS